ncbi:MAG: phosphatidate cytidylyltransferase [Clostridia bacterium]|nr:phosphatidate cytidylyltransferase [Clostridia bacterium]
MKKRIISGICYAALLFGFFLLKIFVHDFCFDVFIYAFTLIGTFEILRAMQDRMTKAERVIVFAFAAIVIPACVLSEYYFRYGLHVTSVCFVAMGTVLLSLLVLRHEETTPENLGVAFFSSLYPTLLLMVLVLVNHVSDPVAITQGKFPAALQEIAFNSDLLIVFVFTVSPVCDVFAFFFGRMFKKQFPDKLAPEISPNKTIIGGIGGLVGGVATAAVIYFVYNAITGVGYVNMHIWLPVYLAIGFLAAAATEFGDLVESCIKRKLGIKDMGNIIPGHGGVLDRIDGTLFASVAVYLIFALLRLLVW